ncbi:hypothetical protein Lser_V15G15873 [Lactuca serriola]
MEEKEILDTFRKVEVNIPLLDAIKQIPRYAKKLPPKCKDPGMFTVPCKIGDVTFSSVMLDLGASINFMPCSVYESLNVGPLSETGVIISLADKSSISCDVSSLCFVDVIEPLTQELFELSNDDMLEMVLSKGYDCGKLARKLKLYSLDLEVERLVNNLEIKKTTQFSVKQIELPQTHTRLPPSLVQPPELELKVLPQHLK